MKLSLRGILTATVVAVAVAVSACGSSTGSADAHASSAASAFKFAASSPQAKKLEAKGEKAVLACAPSGTKDMFTSALNGTASLQTYIQIGEFFKGSGFKDTLACVDKTAKNPSFKRHVKTCFEATAVTLGNKVKNAYGKHPIRNRDAIARVTAQGLITGSEVCVGKSL